MEKLELKHLVPYLPYGLKGLATHDNNQIVLLTGIFKMSNKHLVECSFSENSGFRGECFYMNSFKPILSPLSDLTKEIEVNGEKFVPLEVIGKIIDDDYKCLHDDGLDYIIGKDVSPRCGCPYDCDCMCYTYDLFYKDFNFYSTVYQDGNPDDIIDEIIHESYELVQKLLEWHFDVFGLIEKGLAVDINTL